MPNIGTTDNFIWGYRHGVIDAKQGYKLKPHYKTSELTEFKKYVEGYNAGYVAQKLGAPLTTFQQKINKVKQDLDL